jgi:NAD(P)-dependent dehydrogenase (short-subunit alcohol dehydrogenase family)
LQEQEPAWQSTPHPRRTGCRDHRRRARHRQGDRAGVRARGHEGRDRRRRRTVAEQTAAEIGPNAAAFRLDVTRRKSFEAFVDAAEERFGPLDVLVNNAGIMPLGRFLDETRRPPCGWSTSTCTASSTE